MNSRQIFLVGFFLLFLTTLAMAETPREIVQKADQLWHGKSSYSVGSMTVINPNWRRKISMKAWMLEPDYALILITAPARDKGIVTLKRKNEIWNWIPSIQRVIKIPPSMMLQPWMGSDFTNDDLVRESSMVNDYTQSISGEEKIGGRLCYRIKLTPKPEAGVVWGKVIVWISKVGYLELKAEFFDEEGTLVKTMLASRVRKMGGRTIPTHLEMIPQNKPGHKTVLDYQKLKFNIKIRPSFFSVQNMKRVR